MNLKEGKKIFGLLIIALGIGLFLIILRMKMNEDTWICKDGNWVKHGQPTATMPPGFCK
jgi:hypothetical protein